MAVQIQLGPARIAAAASTTADRAQDILHGGAEVESFVREWMSVLLEHPDVRFNVHVATRATAVVGTARDANGTPT